jgi:hypothetical protein
MSEEPKSSALPTIRVKNLDTREIGMHQGDNCIEDLIVECINAAGIYELRSDPLNGLKLLGQQPLTLSQDGRGGFQVSNAPAQLRFHRRP